MCNIIVIVIVTIQFDCAGQCSGPTNCKLYVLSRYRSRCDYGSVSDVVVPCLYAEY